MEFSLDTKMIALLGYPLRQSFAAKMQNRVYQALGLDSFYLPIECPTLEDFDDVLKGFRKMNIGGFAVTKPYKEKILPYLDDIDDIAKKMGSCNTVQVVDGKWKGYNTDGIGAYRSITEEGGVTTEGKVFFSFGAGGTARSVCFELANHGAKKIILSSRSEACESVANEINGFFPGVCEAVRSADKDKIIELLKTADVVLNLTGLGMGDHIGETPIEKEYLSANQVCFDAIYNPAKTQFLLDAEAQGCKIINGLGMSVYQGSRQIGIWNNIPDPDAETFAAIKEVLGIE